MKQILLVSTVLFCCNAYATDSLLKVSLGLVKDSLPKDIDVSFSKSRIKFDGCKHREYQLRFVKPVSEAFSIEADMTHAKGQLDWGVYNQSVSVMRYSIVPTYHYSEQLAFGAGMTYQSSPDFKTSHSGEFELPEHKKLFVRTRIFGMRQDHHVEFELSRANWQATSAEGNWLEQGKSDSRLTLTYQGSF